jgi:o-succinylbenzoate---CoA ligase
MVVESWLARAATRAPEGLALRTSEADITYSQLLLAARAGAADLASRGAGPGSLVAIALPAGLAFAQALHACLLLGAVVVPIDLRLSRLERERVGAGAKLLVHEPLPVDPKAGLLELGGGHELEQTAVIIHTSGTISASRPVKLSYGNFLWSALGSAVALGVDPQERWLCVLPLSHVGGLSILLRSVIYGTTAVLHERFDVAGVMRSLAEDRITIVSLVATTLTRLLDAGLRRPPALRCVLLGGGPMSAGLLDRARACGLPVSATYGMTETCSQAVTTPLAMLDSGGVLGGQDATSGVPLFCTTVDTGGDGEILVKGPTVARESLRADGWLHTGDQGRLDEHGLLRITGRLAETIISGGENVAPVEVETVLEEHPAVAEVAVVGRPDHRWGEAVTAIVVSTDGWEPTERELRAHCSARLAPYKVPKRVLFRDDPLPRTPSGKLLRRELA